LWTITDKSRWAIDDPNPTAKVEEVKRIEALGKEAISGMIDETLIEAAQTLRALEDGDEEDFYPIEASAPSPEPDMPPAKRSRTNGSEPAGPTGAVKTGIFSADAMENMKFYAEVARKQKEEEAQKQKAPQKGMALLGGYGSEDESD
jgi:hypothetical protein